MTIEELKPYGLEAMREAEVRSFLNSQSVGVLGLVDGDRPYLLPLSYGFDGESSLYFTYVVGAESKKGELTEQAEYARFLVYSAATPFSWESVLLDGTLERIKPSRWSEVVELLEGVWRPEIFQRSKTEGNVRIYEFAITESSGIKHISEPPT